MKLLCFSVTFLLFLTNSVFAQINQTNQGVNNSLLIFALFFILAAIIAVLVYLVFKINNISGRQTAGKKYNLIASLLSNSAFTESEKNILKEFISTADDKNKLFDNEKYFEESLIKFISLKYKISRAYIFKKGKLLEELENKNKQITQFLDKLKDQLPKDSQNSSPKFVSTRLIEKNYPIFILNDKLNSTLKSTVDSNSAFYMDIKMPSEIFNSMKYGDKIRVFIEKNGEHNFSTSVLDKHSNSLRVLHTTDIYNLSNDPSVRNVTKIPVTFYKVNSNDKNIFEGEIVNLTYTGGVIKTSNVLNIDSTIFIKGKWGESFLEFSAHNFFQKKESKDEYSFDYEKINQEYLDVIKSNLYLRESRKN